MLRLIQAKVAGNGGKVRTYRTDGRTDRMRFRYQVRTKDFYYRTEWNQQVGCMYALKVASRVIPQRESGDKRQSEVVTDCKVKFP